MRKSYLPWLIAAFLLFSQTLVATHFHSVQQSKADEPVAISAPGLSHGLYVLQLQKFLYDHDQSLQDTIEHDTACDLCMVSAMPMLVTWLFFQSPLFAVILPARPRMQALPGSSPGSSWPRGPPFKLFIV